MKTLLVRIVWAYLKPLYLVTLFVGMVLSSDAKHRVRPKGREGTNGDPDL